MPRGYRSRVIQPQEVAFIKREGQNAIVEYKDGGGMYFKIGSHIATMTDSEILDCHNQLAQLKADADRRFCPTEIPDGFPQVKFHRQNKMWYPQSDVLRCEIWHDESDAAVYIDDNKLSLEDFSNILRQRMTWGMRVEFLPPSQLADPPETVIIKPGRRHKATM